MDQIPRGVKTKKVGFKFITDLSKFDKRWSEAHFVSFLFHYYCKKFEFPIHDQALTKQKGPNVFCDAWMGGVFLQKTAEKTLPFCQHHTKLQPFLFCLSKIVLMLIMVWDYK